MVKRRKIKLLHVTSSLKIGGAEKVLYELITHLWQYDHHVIYFHQGPYVEKLQQKGIPTYHLKGLLFRYDPLFFIRVYQTIKKINPDVIHTLLWMANFVGRLCARKLKIPYVCVYHNNIDQDGLMRNLIDALVMQKKEALVAVSQQVKQSILEKNVVCPAITVIENGIDNCMNVAQKKRDALSLQENDFVVGAVGRFEGVKQFDQLINIVPSMVKNNPEIKLVLIGFGSQESYLRSLVAQYNLAQTIRLVIAKPAVEYFSLFNCFVQPSMKEGVSLALLEAMSFGIPAIVLAQQKKHPVISHQLDGMIVNNHDQLPAAILALKQDKALAHQLGIQAQQTVNARFSLQHMLHSYNQLFENVRNVNTFSN